MQEAQRLCLTSLKHLYSETVAAETALSYCMDELETIQTNSAVTESAPDSPVFMCSE